MKCLLMVFARINITKTINYLLNFVLFHQKRQNQKLLSGLFCGLCLFTTIDAAAGNINTAYELASMTVKTAVC